MEPAYRVLIRKEQNAQPAPLPPDAVTAVVVDYGDRVLAEVTPAQHQALVAAGYPVEDMRQARIRVGQTAMQPMTAQERSRDVATPGPEGISAGPDYTFVQFSGPVKPEWLDALRGLGLEPLAYYHDYTYLVYGPGAAVDQVMEWPYVQGVVPFAAEVTLPPATRALMADPEVAHDMWLTLFTVGDLAQTLATLRAMGVEIVDQEPPMDYYQRFLVRIPTEVMHQVASLPGLYALDPYVPRQAEDEVASQIIAGNLDSSMRPLVGYRRWLQQVGVDGSGVTIGINDDGIAAGHPAFGGRLLKVHQPVSSHGTMVAGQAAANYVTAQPPDTAELLVDGQGFAYGIGVAPGADLLDIRTALECVTFVGPTGGDRGRIINNSWGRNTASPMDYRLEERQWDGDVRNANPMSPVPVPLVVCFSAGNSGSQGLTRPKAGKNCIVTGNFENFRPASFGVDADDINSRVPQSSIGNCADGRIKPDIVAPGEHTASAAVPPGDISHFLRFGGGTSAASPRTAGACALLIQWWRQRQTVHGSGQTPSPAMVKALLINGAVDTGAGGSIPNREQGWGRIHLNNILNASLPAIYVDQEILLRPQSAPVEFEIDVVDSSRPLKLTLVWTDAPGNPNSGTAGNPALVNALGLRMTQGTHTWFGNNFAGGWSQTGGVQDAVQTENPGRIVNNVQNIFLEHATDRYQVRISPEIIAGDCMNVTGAMSTEFRQDFALAIQNARVAPGSALNVTLASGEGETAETSPAGSTVFLPLVASGAALNTAVRLPQSRSVDAPAIPFAISPGVAEETALDPLRRKVLVLTADAVRGLDERAMARLGHEQQIHIVAAGSAADAEQLQTLARAGHGTLWFGADPAQMPLLYHAILAAESGADVVMHAHGTLDTDEQVVQVPVIGSDRRLHVLVDWDPCAPASGAGIDVTLVAPDGSVIDPRRARRSRRMDYRSEVNRATYWLERPRRTGMAWEGRWAVHLAKLPSAPEIRFALSAVVESSLRLRLAWDKEKYARGETMRLAASVTDPAHRLTQGLSLHIRTQILPREITRATHRADRSEEREQRVARTFVLGEPATTRSVTPVAYDAPHSAQIKTYLPAEPAGVHIHWITVEGTTDSGQPFARSQIVSQLVVTPDPAVRPRARPTR